MKKVLLCNEFSAFPTGYGVYGKELLKRLHQRYEVAELACNIDVNDTRIKNCPWKVYPNKPLENSKDYSVYKSANSFEFGEFTFNSVLLDFKPDYVLDFRDPWTFEFQSRSPFRDLYRWIISPTIDAYPQNGEWIDLYTEADAVLTYSDFGGDVLRRQCPGVNYIGAAYAAPNNAYNRLTDKDRSDLRKAVGLKDTDLVIGTVMRNQPRKLFPDLFKAFRGLLDATGRDDIYLYCHTAFPDLGWNIPELLMNYGIANRTFFTYKCKTCESMTATTFHDSIKYCNNCGKCTNNIVGIGNSIDDTDLNNIYNLMDIYVQISTNEGFGIPVVEAAKTGAVCLAVDYSSMEDFIKKIDTIPIEVLTYIKEANTSRLFAVPDVNECISTLKNLANMPREDLKKIGLSHMRVCAETYNWDHNAEKWIEAIESVPPLPPELGWNSPLDIASPGPMLDYAYTPDQQAEYLICNVLKKPQFMYKYLWRRLIKDLTYRSTISAPSSSKYFHEDSSKDLLNHNEFSFKDAYELMCNLREMYNSWEERRSKS